MALPVDTLLEPLETVLDSRQTDKHLRVSALSIIGVACQTCPVALMDKLWYLMNWILNILEVEKTVEIRRGTFQHILLQSKTWLMLTTCSYQFLFLRTCLYSNSCYRSHFISVPRVCKPNTVQLPS
jgi:hypothetical protein